MKRWKVALSLAVIAAIAVPVLAGTWQLDPGKWVALTKSDTDDIWKDLRVDYCPDIGRVGRVACLNDREKLKERAVYGGYWDRPPERFTWRHVVKNLAVAASAFGVAFALVMVIRAITRRYWQWLWR